MAYQLGRLAHIELGCETFAVTVGGERAGNGVFNYDPVFPSVSIDEMEAEIRPSDLLIANPSFSNFNFGLRVRCRKLMYIQGFNTFRMLDMQFSRYVYVSEFVRSAVSNIYGIQGAVIPPHIEIDAFPLASAWRDRPKSTVLVYRKGDQDLQKLLFQKLQSIAGEKNPEISIDQLPIEPIPHTQLIETLGRYRYLVTLAAAEGFGLVPLEAMRMGTTVIGFDAFGGRQYMRSGQNCLIAQYPDVNAIVDHLIGAIDHEQFAEKLATNGHASAIKYSYERFRNAWIAEFKSLLADSSV
jgi:hypothetical protein